MTITVYNACRPGWKSGFHTSETTIEGVFSVYKARLANGFAQGTHLEFAGRLYHVSGKAPKACLRLPNMDEQEAYEYRDEIGYKPWMAETHGVAFAGLEG